MSLAREFKPGAITLDIGLPDMAGWTILDRLKHDPATRHIPVHIISGDENRRRGMALGAMSYLEKAVAKDSLAEAFAAIEHSAQKRVKKLLLVVRRRCEASGDDSDCWQRRTSRSIGVATGGRSAGRARSSSIWMESSCIWSIEDIAPMQLGGRDAGATGPHVPPIILLCNARADVGRRAELARLAAEQHRQAGSYARTAAR